MRSGVIAQKVGMTRIFTDAGEHIPVTVLKLDASVRSLRQKTKLKRTATRHFSWVLGKRQGETRLTQGRPRPVCRRQS